MSPQFWHSVWLHWTWSAVIVGFIVLAVYIAFIGPYRHKIPASRPVPGGIWIYFVLGMLVYLIAFASPIDYLGDVYSFSAHMVQHMLEVSVMVPLMILGLPDWLVSWGLKWRPLYRLMKLGTQPAVAILGFDVIFDGFHFPVLYDLTLTNDVFHVVEHLLFFVGAWMVWWLILSRNTEIPRLTPGWRLLFIFFAFDGMMPPAILIFMWNSPLYWPYERVPHIFGFGPVTDQHIGSLIMMGFMVVSYGWAALSAFLQYDMGEWYE